MRYGFFGDIHGEIERLEAVLNALKEKGIDEKRLICLGDIVSDTENQKTDECIDLLIKRGAQAVVGNHDEVRYKIEKKTQVLSGRSMIYLESLMGCRQLQLGDMIVIHDNLLPEAQNGMGRWARGSYIYTVDDAQAVLEGTMVNCFKLMIGHNHQSKVFWNDDSRSLDNGGSFRYSPEVRYIFSPGSVAGSRDSNPAPACAIYDSEQRLFEVIKVKYKDRNK